MIRLEVPEMSLLGDTVAMHCYYHMEGEQLYSVKWYKEGQEFFRYLNYSHILPTITMTFQVYSWDQKQSQDI